MRAYGRDLEGFLTFLADDFLARSPESVSPDEVDALAVRSYLASLASRGIGPRSQARALSAVRGLLKFGCREASDAR